MAYDEDGGLVCISALAVTKKCAAHAGENGLSIWSRLFAQAKPLFGWSCGSCWRIDMDKRAYLRGYCQGAKLADWLSTYNREVAYLCWVLDAQAIDKILLGHGGGSARAFLVGKLDALLDAVS